MPGSEQTGGGGRLSTLMKLYSSKAKISRELHNARAAGPNYYDNFGVERFLYLETGKWVFSDKMTGNFSKSQKMHILDLITQSKRAVGLILG